MNIANGLTLIRFFLIPFFVISLFQGAQFQALGIFAFAAFSDILDGWIARRYRKQTFQGAVIDPAADKFLMVSAYILLPLVVRRGFLNIAVFPFWVSLIVLSRDLLIVLGWVFSKIKKVSINFTPSVYGKITTFSQAATIIAVLSGFTIAHWLWNLTVVLTIISGIEYLTRGVKDWQTRYVKRFGD